jgi:tetratricopeptide (TPR) repeat protein
MLVRASTPKSIESLLSLPLVLFCTAGVLLGQSAPTTNRADAWTEAANVEAYTVEQCNKDELALAQHLEQAYPDSDEALMFLGNVLWDQGRSAAAAKRWQEAVQINPRRADAYRALARHARQEGLIEQAVEHWNKALKLEPASVDVRIDAADALISIGEYERAKAQLQQGLPAAPPVASWHYLMGEAHLKQQEYDRARAYYEQAIAFDPEHSSAYYGLFTACSRTGMQGRAAKYAAVFRQLKAKERDRSLVYTAEYQQLQAKDRSAAQESVALPERQRTMARLVRRYTDGQARIGADAKAPRSQELLQRAFGLLALMSKLEPRNPSPHLNAGIILTQLRQFPQAQKAFGTAIDLAPDRDEAYRHLALCYLSARTDLPAALRAARRAVSINPSAENQFALGFASQVTGDRSGALTAIREAVRLAPERQDWRRVLERLEAAP